MNTQQRAAIAAELANLGNGSNQHKKEGISNDIPSSDKVITPVTIAEAAETWIINNQLGRRNLHPDQISVLRGKRYNLEKQALGGQIPGSRVGKTCPPIPTAERLADEYHVSPRTIKNDGKFAEAVDALEEMPELDIDLSGFECDPLPDLVIDLPDLHIDFDLEAFV